MMNSGDTYFGTVAGSSEPPGNAAAATPARSAAGPTIATAPVTAPALMICRRLSMSSLPLPESPRAALNRPAPTESVGQESIGEGYEPSWTVGCGQVSITVNDCDHRRSIAENPWVLKEGKGRLPYFAVRLPSPAWRTGCVGAGT